MNDVMGRQPAKLPDAERFSRQYFASVPVDLNTLGAFQSHHFPDSGPLPWLDRPEAKEEIGRRLAAGTISEEEAEYCQHYREKGYVTFSQLVSSKEIDLAWTEYEAAIAKGLLVPAPEKKGEDDPHPSNTFNAHVVVPEIRNIINSKRVQRIVQTLLGVDPLLFQSLVFPKSREQPEHSDLIYMTTYPQGYMCAVWIAFEDVHPDSGPLMYYPYSHRSKYVSAHDAGIQPGEFAQKLYGVIQEKLEPKIMQVVREHGYQREIFLPKKGDVFIWHANLIHGGSERKDVKHSRRSMVGHFVGNGAFVYHDLSGDVARASTTDYDNIRGKVIEE
jgi:hypothetical protein